MNLVVQSPQYPNEAKPSKALKMQERANRNALWLKDEYLINFGMNSFTKLKVFEHDFRNGPGLMMMKKLFVAIARQISG